MKRRRELTINVMWNEFGVEDKREPTFLEKRVEATADYAKIVHIRHRLLPFVIYEKKYSLI